MKVLFQSSKGVASVFLKRVPSILVFIVSLLFSFFLMFHTFGYDGKERTILIASKVWSDFGAHIPLIRSFSLGDNLGLLLEGRPEYPIYSGEPIRYHFLFYAFVGLLERMGLRLDWALNIPSALGFFALLLCIYWIALTMFHDARVGVLSVVFFLFNGSLAFVQFFLRHPLSVSTVTDILRATEFPAFAPWGPGDVSAFWNLNIYTNQRHLAVGFTIALGFILTALRIEKLPFHKQRRWAISWGVIIGLLPYLHTPTLVIMAILVISYFFLFRSLRKFLFIAGSIGAVLVVPQLLSFPQNPTSIRWYPGYLIHDQLSLLRFLGYWWQNLGLHSILIPIGFFFIPLRAKKALVPILPIFIIANLFQFSVEVAANHKLFNFSLIMGTIISAYTVVYLLHQYNNITIKQLRMPLQFVVSVELIGLLTLSGLIDFFVVFNDQKGGVADVGNSAVATWIAQYSPNSSVFLNSSFLYPPASLAGRKIFLGWPYFAWSAGYQGNRSEVMKTIYESRDPSVFCPLLTQNHIDYVSVEDTGGDTNLPTIDVAYFLTNFSPAFINENKTYAIFTTQALCKP